MMLEEARPSCEATISEEMVQLLLALRHGGRSSKDGANAEVRTETTSDRGPGAAARAAVDTCADDLPDAGTAGWLRVSLRQDGARPFVFAGLRLCGWRQQVPVRSGGTLRAPLDRAVTLYLDRQGSPVAHVVCSPGHETEGRPIHRVLRLDPASNLGPAIRALSGQQCFDVSPETRCRVAPAALPPWLRKGAADPEHPPSQE